MAVRRPRAAAWPPFARGVIDRFSVKAFAATLGLASAVTVIGTLYPGDAAEFWPALLSRLVVHGVQAFLVLIGVLCADEAVSRGARRARAYPPAVAVAALLGATAQWYVFRRLGILLTAELGDASLPAWAEITAKALSVATTGGLATFAYVNRQIANQLLKRVRQVELRRLDIARRLTAAELAATLAQYDPEELFAELAQIRSHYLSGSPEAQSRLDGLIARLRAALATTAAAERAVGNS
jgi:hypothetical protein